MYTRDRFTGEKILKPPLKLIGAKTKIRDFLYKAFPADYDAYFEPFMGTAGVLIGSKKVEREVIGDLNEYAILFYKVLKMAPLTLFGEILDHHRVLVAEGKPYFEEMKKQVITPHSFTRACFFYLITKHCMNGIWRLNKKGECNSSWCKTVHGRGILTPEWLKAVHKRIKDVDFVRQDYLATMMQATAHGEGAFLFLDPPYHECKTTYNGIGFNDANFHDLKNAMDDAHNTGVKVLLTINDDPFIRELFNTAPWQIHPFNVFYSCSQTAAGRGAKPELLVSNYSLEHLKELKYASTKKTRKPKAVERVDRNTD